MNIDNHFTNLENMYLAAPINKIYLPKIKVSDSGAEIICFAYSLNEAPAKLWLPGSPPPYDWYNEDVKVYAHNSQFDKLVTNMLGGRYSLPPLPISKCIDTMALCGRFTYPQALEKVGKVLNLDVQKMKEGSKLKQKICMPPFEYTRAELYKFYEYCLTDVDTMVELVSKLPMNHLSDREQEIWEMTCWMNANGLPVDLPSAVRIFATVNYRMEEALKGLSDLTDGVIDKITQTKRIKNWVSDQGFSMSDCTIDTVTDMLDRTDLTPEVKELLELRQEFGLSSIKKYKSLIDGTLNGRLHETSRYYGTNTGRSSGLSFQPLNLPRATVDDVEGTIAKFMDMSILDPGQDPLYNAKALIRSMVCSDLHHTLLVADYKSIENIMIAWASGQEDVLDLFRKGIDEYKTFATQLYGVPYDDVTDKQRGMCKPIILGAGFGLGWRGLLSYVTGFGLSLSDTEARYAINTYRQTHPEVVKLWYGLVNAGLQALHHPGEPFSYKDTTFKVIKAKGIQANVVLVNNVEMKRLNKQFIEMDETIEQREGKEIVDIFSQKGEDYFRKLEKNLLTELSRREDLVISCGGGLVCHEENLSVLKETGVVFSLMTSASVIYERTKKYTRRPLLNVDSPLKEIEELLTKRARYYNQAHYTIKSEEQTPEEVANAIINLIEAESPGTKRG